MPVYLVEIKRSNKSRIIAINAVHPDQAVRKVVMELESGNYELFVVNKDGFAWQYFVDKKIIPRVRLVNKSYSPLNSTELDSIRAGNTKPSEVLK